MKGDHCMCHKEYVLGVDKKTCSRKHSSKHMFIFLCSVSGFAKNKQTLNRNVLVFASC